MVPSFHCLYQQVLKSRGYYVKPMGRLVKQQSLPASRGHDSPLCTDHFQRLLNDSERTLQDAFPGAFGDLYTQNTRAFRDLYAELRLYYRGANLHLEETLAEFWARLLERLFKQLHPQLLPTDDYLDCLGKQAEALRPFGDAPRELRLRATRAFVAARSFVQGLGVASDVVRKVAQVHILPKALSRPLGVSSSCYALGAWYPPLSALPL